MSEINIPFGNDYITVKEEAQKEAWKSLAIVPSNDFMIAFLMNRIEEKSALIRHSIREADLNTAVCHEGYVTALEDVFNLLNGGIAEAFKEDKKDK